jgi:glycosyltransferase involved in cell wall biosynthesis
VKTSRLLLFSADLLSFGGMQRHDRLVVSALDRYVSGHGGSLSVYCLNDAPPAQLPPELAGLKATDLRFFAGNRASFVTSVVRAVRRSSLVMYGLLAFAPLACIQRIVNPRSRRVLFVHGIEAWQYRSPLHALGVRQMQHIVSVSQYTLDLLRREYGLTPSGHDFILPNPVSPDLLDAADRVHLGAGDTGPPRLVSVTRLGIHDAPKGIDRVIEALPTLLRQFPDLVYRVIGDGPDRVRLAALAKRLGVEQSVCFRGWISEQDLMQEFAACTLYVMPSVKEGFGLVFIEAMAYGKPVVAARATAVPEVVPHLKAGLLIEPDNVMQLANAISALIADPSRRLQMGAAGRTLVHQEYSFAAFQQRLFSILDSLQ